MKENHGDTDAGSCYTNERRETASRPKLSEEEIKQAKKLIRRLKKEENTRPTKPVGSLKMSKSDGKDSSDEMKKDKTGEDILIKKLREEGRLRSYEETLLNIYRKRLRKKIEKLTWSKDEKGNMQRDKRFGFWLELDEVLALLEEK